MIMLDTHALLWYQNDRDQIPPRTLKQINHFFKIHRLMISQITLWEISMLFEKKRINLSIPFREYMQIFSRVSQIKTAGITPSVAAKCYELKDDLDGDPADRIIASTALDLGIPIVSKDTRFNKVKDLNVIWN